MSVVQSFFLKFKQASMMNFKNYVMVWICVVAVTQLVSCGLKSPTSYNMHSSIVSSIVSDDAYNAVFTKPASSCKARNLSKTCLNWMKELAKAVRLNNFHCEDQQKKEVVEWALKTAKESARRLGKDTKDRKLRRKLSSYSRELRNCTTWITSQNEAHVWIHLTGGGEDTYLNGEIQVTVDQNKKLSSDDFRVYINDVKCSTAVDRFYEDSGFVELTCQVKVAHDSIKRVAVEFNRMLKEWVKFFCGIECYIRAPEDNLIEMRCRKHITSNQEKTIMACDMKGADRMRSSLGTL